jgi:hypothetical protein
MTENCRKRFLRQKRNGRAPFLLTIIATVGLQCMMRWRKKSRERHRERERERERERTANGPKQWLVESRLQQNPDVRNRGKTTQKRLSTVIAVKLFAKSGRRSKRHGESVYREASASAVLLFRSSSDPLQQLQQHSRRRRKPEAVSCFFCQLPTQIRQFKENPLKDQRKTGLQQPPTNLFFLMIIMKGG